MKAKREAQPPRAGDRRRGQSNASRKPGRPAAEPTAARRTRRGPGKLPRRPASHAVAVRAADLADGTARRTTGRPKSATQAKARAKARKAKEPKVVRPPLRERLLNRLASIDLRPQTLAAKVPFVVLVIGSLGAGLGLTLWLSTDSAERSYQLGSARQRTELLQQQKEALERDVQEAQSAPALAEAARGLGMIPTGTPRISCRIPRELGRGRHSQAGPGRSAATAEQQAARRTADATQGSAGEFG